jgi:hypothetical protein
MPRDYQQDENGLGVIGEIRCARFPGHFDVQRPVSAHDVLRFVPSGAHAIHRPHLIARGPLTGLAVRRCRRAAKEYSASQATEGSAKGVISIANNSIRS